jgi:hypothetical protein
LFPFADNKRALQVIPAELRPRRRENEKPGLIGAELRYLALWSCQQC